MARLIRRLIAIAIRLAASVFAILLIAGIATIGYNNRNVGMPDQKELADSLDASVVWLTDNRDAILDVDNPILWYFLQRAGQITGDPRIRSLVDIYYAGHIETSQRAAGAQGNLWFGMFNPGFRGPSVAFDRINRLPYYNQHFVYAINCDSALGELDSIRAQDEPGFCGRFHILKPTCTTHQLMGVRFMQRADCGDPAQLAQTVRELQTRVVRELTYDPRVVDVYLQRVMMLIESGSPELVDNVWIRRILDNQLPDGGWGNFQPIFSLRDSEPRFFGFGHAKSETGNPRAGGRLLRVFGVGQPRSTFHATAQGTLLLALLLDRNRQESAELSRVR